MTGFVYNSFVSVVSTPGPVTVTQPASNAPGGNGSPNESVNGGGATPGWASTTVIHEEPVLGLSKAIYYMGTFGDTLAGLNQFQNYCIGHNISPGTMSILWNQARNMMEEKKHDMTPKDRPDFLETTFRKYFSGRRIKACKGEIGLEIEAEGKNLFNSPIQYWNAVSDGSLRQYEGHPPLEYVLREPIKRDEVKDALMYLADRLKSAKSELHMSHRCSVHVHVNAQDMTMKHLINYMALYFIFEDVLVHWASPERKGNLFCLRAKDAEFQINMMKRAIVSGDFMSEVFEKEYRYSAMNFSALGEHGSLEFRAMKGTVDITTISNWVSILLALKDAASDFKTPDVISRRFQDLGPLSFFNDVFRSRLPLSLRTELKSCPDLHKVLWDSFRVMRDICHAVDWNDPPKWMAGTKKEPLKKLSVVSNNEEW